MDIFSNACPWYFAGPLLGLLVAGLLWAINKPLGALGGYCDAILWLEQPEAGPSWRVVFLGGIVIGGALSALVAGSYQPTLIYGAFTSTIGATLGVGGVVLFLGGTMIGYGARLGGGCTSGHGMCGMALGSPASIFATMTFMGTAAAVANVLAVLIGGGP